MKIFLFFLATLCGGGIAQAHFTIRADVSEDMQRREIHILKSEEGDTRVILRFPLKLAYANELARRVPGTEFTALFMKTRKAGESTFYHLDSDAVLDSYDGFADFLRRDFRFSVNGDTVKPEIPEYLVIDTRTKNETIKSIEPGLLASTALLSLCASDFPDSPRISDTLIVISFFLPEVLPTDPLKIELLSAPFQVPAGKAFETRIADYRQGAAKFQTFEGTGFEPVTLAGSRFASFIDFIKKLKPGELFGQFFN